MHGKINYVFAFLIKYIAPIIILGIFILGLIDSVFPNYHFEANGLLIELIAIGLIGVLIAIYFIFLKNKDTGDNEAEEA